MSIFNFGDKQRLHTQMFGHTSGKEMFKVDEYNKVKQVTMSLCLALFLFFTIFYFGWSSIPLKFKGFMFIICILLGGWLYFNVKSQLKLKEYLYD